MELDHRKLDPERRVEPRRYSCCNAQRKSELGDRRPRIQLMTGSQKSLPIAKLNKTYSGLAPWASYPELEHVSGIAQYTTSFELEASEGHHMLELGQIEDGYTVTLNGQPVDGFDRVSHCGDISRYISPGLNSESGMTYRWCPQSLTACGPFPDLVIKTASPLVNALTRARPEVYGTRTRTINGVSSS